MKTDTKTRKSAGPKHHLDHHQSKDLNKFARFEQTKDTFKFNTPQHGLAHCFSLIVSIKKFKGFLSEKTTRVAIDRLQIDHIFEYCTSFFCLRRLKRV